MTRDFSRQSFLGEDSEKIFESCKIGLVGLGGGGSHIAQQLSHIGVLNYVISDPDIVEDSNLNRLVGATAQDVVDKRLKTDIAKRLILRVNPRAVVECISEKWQASQIAFRDCCVIFGCIDSYSEREQLERFCRRFLIAYIDIGMDVVKYEDGCRIVGQVAQSFPGAPCLRCMAILTEHKLGQEAEGYGAAGSRPQVIWPNGVLASTAISLFVRLMTQWGPKQETAYLEYNGNDSIMGVSARLPHVLKERCTHYATPSVGDPLFRLI